MINELMITYKCYITVKYYTCEELRQYCFSIYEHNLHRCEINCISTELIVDALCVTLVNNSSYLHSISYEVPRRNSFNFGHLFIRHPPPGCRVRCARSSGTVSEFGRHDLLLREFDRDSIGRSRNCTHGADQVPSCS